jgi:hypothetical protein
MLFSVNSDEGTKITGYVVPDNPSVVPAVRITDGRRDLLVLHCQADNPGLVTIGRHTTGRCVFIIDETTIRDLPHQHALEIYDNETNLLIYRRRPPAQVTQKRILRLETQLFPLWRLDDAVQHHFQYFHKGIDRYGGETIMQMFVLFESNSIYLSGRLVFKAYEVYMDNHLSKTREAFSCVALLRDPYVELAETLLTLKHARKFGNVIFGERDMIAYDEAISFAAGLEADEKVLRRAFSTMPGGAIRVLANPLTRQLAAPSADGRPLLKGALATALDTLSGFAIVGLREREDLFIEEFAQLIGADAISIPPMPEFPNVADLAQYLRRLPEADILIERDLEIHQHVKFAHESAHNELSAGEIS